MDLNKKNESRDRSREEVLARRLGEALDRVDPRGAEPCPDAELIAAYHERALTPEETAHYESHFAACSRCRKILAVLAASAETPLAEAEVARLGVLVAAAQVPREAAARSIQPTRPNRFDWRARWLAPALGVAAVLAVWFAIRPPWHTVNQKSLGTLIAQAPKSETAPNAAAPALDQFSNAAPANKQKADSATPSTDSATPSKDQEDRQRDSKTGSRKAPAEAFAKNPLDGGDVGEIAPNAGVANSLSVKKKEMKAENASSANGGPAPSSAVPAAPSLQAEVQVAPQLAPPEPRVASNAPARALAAPATRAEPSSKSAAADKSMASFGTLTGAPAMKMLRSPSGAVSWRIGTGGRVERSNDAGRTWIAQVTPSQQEWLAGAALSVSTCWLVGRNGAIARTTDGVRWEQIASPLMAADSSGKLPDWIGITAVDAQTATIMTGDQRRYETQDGGKTWREQ